MVVRDDVLKALEEARNAKVIGKSLEAKVTVVLLKDEYTALFEQMNIDFAQLFIVSKFALGGAQSEASLKIA